MPKDLAVAIIHGIGNQRPGFADDIIAELSDRIDESDRVAWQEIYWADVLQPRQNAYLTAAKNENDLDFIKLRELVVGALGDASAYRRIDGAPGTTYEQIHTVVRNAVRSLFEGQLESHEVPLVILAHSMGGHVMSNYIWDIQHGRPVVVPGANEFEQMNTLAGIFTFGCNIPLFTFALDDVQPIDLPAGASWHNYYDPDDILGYPLKQISDAYGHMVSDDVSINVGSVFSSWNPASHNKYWTDNDFTKPVAQFLSNLL